MAVSNCLMGALGMSPWEHQRLMQEEGYRRNMDMMAAQCYNQANSLGIGQQRQNEPEPVQKKPEPKVHENKLLLLED